MIHGGDRAESKGKNELAGLERQREKEKLSSWENEL